MKQLNEKVAVVTGAGQGIGKGIALCLAKRGVKVIATGRRLEPIEATIAEIKELGGDGLAMSCDSADRERVFEVVKTAVDTFGSIDVIVNNGQAIVPSQPVEDTEYENMLKAWQSGVIGSLNYMQAAFPYMKEQHEGRIINFASATGMFGIAGQLAYGSNKEALRGLTKIAAKEWGQYGICVNIVLPGAESPAAKAWAEKFPEEYAKQVNLNPMKRFGDPEADIAPRHRLPRRSGLLLLLRTERHRRRRQQHHAVTGAREFFARPSVSSTHISLISKAGPSKKRDSLSPSIDSTILILRFSSYDSASYTSFENSFTFISSILQLKEQNGNFLLL